MRFRWCALNGIRKWSSDAVADAPWTYNLHERRTKTTRVVTLSRKWWSDALSLAPNESCVFLCEQWRTGVWHQINLSKKKHEQWHFISFASAEREKRHDFVAFDNKKDCWVSCTRHNCQSRFESCNWRRQFNEKPTKNKTGNHVSNIIFVTTEPKRKERWNDTSSIAISCAAKSTKKRKNEKWIYDVQMVFGDKFDGRQCNLSTVIIFRRWPFSIFFSAGPNVCDKKFAMVVAWWLMATGDCKILDSINHCSRLESQPEHWDGKKESVCSSNGRHRSRQRRLAPHTSHAYENVLYHFIGH